MVHRKKMQLHHILADRDVVLVPNEDYPTEVIMVRIGDEDAPVSKELCGGTHVVKTSDIQEFCITRMSNVAQGVKRVFAVTGLKAIEAHKNGTDLLALCSEFSSDVSSHRCSAADLQHKSQCIRAMLQEELLPYTARDHANSLVEKLAQYVSAATNREKVAALRQEIEDLLVKEREAPFLISSINFDGKLMLKALSLLELNRPLALISCEKKSSVAIVSWPKDCAPQDAVEELKGVLGSSNLVKIKTVNGAKDTQTLMVTIKGSDLGGWLFGRMEELLLKTASR